MTAKTEWKVRLAEVKAAVQKQITEIKADSRFKARPALVQVNAPLALIQVNMKAQLQAYENVLVMLGTIR